MGTSRGLRTRKYHGLYSGIAGRAETAFLADWEVFVTPDEGPRRRLWPHLYGSPQGPVLDDALEPMSFSLDEGPRWEWRLGAGRLSFGISAIQGGGMRLGWSWSGRRPLRISIRPFFAFRGLHALGGESWSLAWSGAWPEPASGRRGATVRSESGREASLELEGAWAWTEAPLWYRAFQYPVERERGYAWEEDLFSAGELEAELRRGDGASWWVAPEPGATRELLPGGGIPLLDFVLENPAGVVAGYPWFGEWGRDTFVSLPGIVLSWLRHGGDAERVWAWAEGCLDHWGRWIPEHGMLPNLVEAGGKHQWESADGTLWWTHALASLWALSLEQGEDRADRFRARWSPLLDQAVDAIRAGRHRFLRADGAGLLEVTEPHSTWMDARVEGVACTPRTGVLPEINALWFQARALQFFWSGSGAGGFPHEELGRAALLCREPGRPHRVFLHSLPLAPSFVLGDRGTAERDVRELREEFWTPVGLRTLSPSSPGYVPGYEGTQERRDRVYHQGPAWAWLGGHFEMAEARAGGKSGMQRRGPIDGHVAELFDAEAPFAARGAPAQAWSLACFEEAAERRRRRLDARLTEVLARRWTERAQRPRARTRSRRSGGTTEAEAG